MYSDTELKRMPRVVLVDRLAKNNSRCVRVYAYYGKKGNAGVAGEKFVEGYEVATYGVETYGRSEDDRKVGSRMFGDVREAMDVHERICVRLNEGGV